MCLLRLPLRVLRGGVQDNRGCRGSARGFTAAAIAANDCPYSTSAVRVYPARMGFLDNLKSTVGSVKAGIDSAREAEAARMQAEREAPIDIIDPTPQDQIDAGAKRGVVRAFNFDLQDGGHVASMAVTVYVRARLAAGELGPDTKLKIRTSSTVARKLVHGLEVPIEVDATGIPTSVDTTALAAELS